MYYRRRLAEVHAADYAQYARAAAQLLVAELEGPGVVIDLGCGAGDLCEPVRAASFDYLGVDLSPDMVALAQRRFPDAAFRQGSAFDLPSLRGAAGIVAVGEVVNYATDPRAGASGLAAWLRECRQRLRPGGILLLDVAGPLRGDPEPTTTITVAQDYRIAVTVSTDPGRRVLRRTITVDDGFGRDTEVHELHLIDPVEVMAAFGQAGFEPTALQGYAPDLPFPRGWSGFLARVILDT
ncbi:MAG: class I SAM-dependent methyltransferase [Micrococcales bacterium]|nr:class I SAM-dependent methyltransferase [Micrococcales bacterium]